MTLILSILGRKGGITKTTVAVNLAAVCALNGLFTVFIEADGQGNASEHMGIQPHDGLNAVILGDREWADVLKPVPYPFAGGGAQLLALSASDLTFQVEKDERTPARMIKALNALRGWADVVIIDTSPGANNIHVGCYYASDYVLLPTLCELDSINSLSKTLRYLETAEFAGSGDLHAAKVLGILPNRYVKGERDSQFNLGMVAGRFAHEYHVFPHIHDTQAWKLARRDERSIFAYKPKDYRERESRKLARKDFQPLVDRVLEFASVKQGVA